MNTFKVMQEIRNLSPSARKVIEYVIFRFENERALLPRVCRGVAGRTRTLLEWNCFVLCCGGKVHGTFQVWLPLSPGIVCWKNPNEVEMTRY